MCTVGIMNLDNTVNKILKTISAIPSLPLHSEKELQQVMFNHIKDLGIKREVKLSEDSTIDFMSDDGLGIEVKRSK